MCTADCSGDDIAVEIHAGEGGLIGGFSIEGEEDGTKGNFDDGTDCKGLLDGSALQSMGTAAAEPAVQDPTGEGKMCPNIAVAEAVFAVSIGSFAIPASFANAISDLLSPAIHPSRKEAYIPQHLGTCRH
jgi:hypothetical protein